MLSLSSIIKIGSELIKAGVQENCDYTAREAADEIAKLTGSEVVQGIGRRYDRTRGGTSPPCRQKEQVLCPYAANQTLVLSAAFPYGYDGICRGNGQGKGFAHKRRGGKLNGDTREGGARRGFFRACSRGASFTTAAFFDIAARTASISPCLISLNNLFISFHPNPNLSLLSYRRTRRCSSRVCISRGR